jgi:hypothetical protein
MTSQDMTFAAFWTSSALPSPCHFGYAVDLQLSLTP